uniref:Putative rho gtpase-activating protein 17 n=1 Tax=Rhodnius neglectus TaxID=72488 RepID=A0A0P4VP04_9HEMI
MKKQFFRVKQLADQTFSRAGKTEALSDDLQDAERRVEFIRTTCLNTGKKLGNPSSGHDPAVREKRLKKNPEYCLGTSLLECASLEEEHLLRQVVTDCGKLQMCLANAIVDHEMRVENNVIVPLNNICENDYPNIVKQKRTLSKLILDMDSAKTRYLTALKHSSSTTASKADSIKDELEEAEAKVEQCRDALACEMLQLISRESELASTILEYAKLQRNYHVTAVAILDEIIPEMESRIYESNLKPVFGRPLEEHLRVTGRKIAYPIELCVCGLLELGIAEEGLFRVAPGASKLRRMKLSLDANYLDFETALQFRDPHLFAGVLKSYLRELPEPLLTHRLYDQWMSAARTMASGNQKGGLSALWNVVYSLPQANLDNLHYLVKFLASLASNKHSNKMTPQNLAIVIAPNIIWSPNDDSNNIGLNMNVANLHSIIVDSLVSFCDWFFRDEIDFYVTLSKDVGFINGHNNESQSDSLAPVDIKRTQSNDSLSDHNSPPHGSPKPMVRSRKHKPTAPHPPVNHPKSEDKGVGVKEEKVISTSTSSTNTSTIITTTSCAENKDENKDRKADIKLIETKFTSTKEVKEKETGTKEFKESKDINKKEELKREEIKKKDCPSVEGLPLPAVRQVEDSKSLPPIIDVPEEQSERLAIVNEQSQLPNRPVSDSLQKSEDYSQGLIGSGRLDKRTSKSGEDVRKIRLQEACPAMSVGGYSTLDRKRPPGRPTPAPRTIVDLTSNNGDKPAVPERPAIPERPAVLQRPHSSSFRIIRPGSLDSPTDPVEGRSLERAHLYCLDKQQVAIVHVNNDKVAAEKKQMSNNERDKKDTSDKPEKPRKPECLTSYPGHHRAASEGSIIDTSGSDISRRPPRPTPPPPPPTQPQFRRESTDN